MAESCSNHQSNALTPIINKTKDKPNNIKLIFCIRVNSLGLFSFVSLSGTSSSLILISLFSFILSFKYLSFKSSFISYEN